ncbi:MAG: hypothetical protein Q8O26_16045 [Phreatobacter sp.]|uniref:hypothetical protein n=1 Tax=Phreatobacter sp. TaxID=1966341 RepID=UPI0027356884|nr:hypothetical protein [Phreatobacter sp.]MDP2803385.1 hypothetical protein [Phreatobacter sp.]
MTDDKSLTGRLANRGGEIAGASACSTAPCPHLGHLDQVRLAGQPVTLGASSATSPALVFHELANSAVKYGALAEEGGDLDIAWTAAATELTLTWSKHRRTASAQTLLR